jgi:serine/threonine protein kinase
MSGPDPTRVRGAEGGADATRLRDAAPAQEPAPTLTPTPTLTRDSSSQSAESELRAAAAALQALPSSGPAAATPPPTARFEPGYRVRDRYVLEELIGAGSMGQVWRAKDSYAEKLRYSSPDVALKVLNADFELNENAYVALHREAARGASLGHPNIVDVQLFDFDPQSQRAFIVMELLQGQSLDDLLREAAPQGLPRQQALALIRGMADGLAYAHRKGIVHSDFKPANVFVTADGLAKILDFGISRHVPMQGEAKQADENVFKGYTLMYAAPEAIVGSDASTAEDVFALGVVAYELVAGRHPFGRRSALEARDQHLTPPSLRGLRRREGRAIARALAFEPKERFPDAAAFNKALQGIAPVQLALAAVALVLLIAAGGFWYRSYLASGPDVPFEQLPTATQKDVRAALDDGGAALDYLQRTHDISGSQDAAYAYAKAYSLHPRNREAVAGLERAADLAIEWYTKQPDRREALAQLKLFRQKSEFYDTYAPLSDAITQLSGP